jgi:hypothetical protein
MAHQLTYADRELLMGVFDTLEGSSNETNEQIVKRASQWAEKLESKHGFELALARDITFISRCLMSHRQSPDVVGIARGSLLYLLRPSQSGSTGVVDLGRLGEAFVCAYAAYEVRSRIGERATWKPFKLTHDEKQRAAAMLLQFAKTPLMEDAALILKSREICGQLENLANCGLFRRLRTNSDFLVSALADSSRRQKHLTYARAGLSYMVCQQDVIDDRLGLIGYIDDDFIVQLAVDLIEPKREPWLDFLDEIVGRWPFLNGLVFDDGSGGYPLSEYMIVNSALTCTQLRGRGTPASVLLVTPSVGPVPFLLGFISALGLIQESMAQGAAGQSIPHPGLSTNPRWRGCRRRLDERQVE